MWYLTVAVLIMAIGGYLLPSLLTKKLEEMRAERQRLEPGGARIAAQFDQFLMAGAPSITHGSRCASARVVRRRWNSIRLQILVVIELRDLQQLKKLENLTNEFARAYDSKRSEPWKYPVTFKIEER